MIGCIMSCLSWSDEPHINEQSTAMTHAILKRFYIINRLERTCAGLFSTLLPEYALRDTLKELLPILQHERIYGAIRMVHAVGNLGPLQQVWQEICAYRFLDDQLLIQEFTRILYLLLTHYKTHTPQAQAKPLERAGGQEILAAELPDIKAITQRFYLIQRLQHAVQVCTKQHHRSLTNPDFMVMLSWWDDLQQYKYIDNVAVSFGICSAIIALLQGKPMQLNPATDTTPANTDSLEQILEHIDILADNYQ